MRPRTHLQFNMSTTVLLLTMMHLNYKTWGSYMAHRQAQCWSLQHKLWGQLQGKLASPTEPPQEPCGKLLFKWKFNSSANNMWSPEGHGDHDRYPFCGNTQREDGTQTPLLKDLKSIFPQRTFSSHECSVHGSQVWPPQDLFQQTNLRAEPGTSFHANSSSIFRCLISENTHQGL